LFFLGGIFACILEYIVSWVLEKLFHARWWDYSDFPANLNGRICLPASTFFGLGGLLIIYVLYEPTVQIISLADPLATEMSALLLMAAIAADTAITASSLASIARAASAINQGVNDDMDRFVINVHERGAQVAGELEERRDETTQALKAAAASVRRREEALSEQLERSQQTAQDKIDAERRRFAAAMRASQVGQMGTLVRSAASRAMRTVSPDQLPDIPEREQLAQLWRDMLER
jgi:uncharacterized membrane protein